MSEFCKHFLIEKTCLLRQLAKGAVAATVCCTHCQKTSQELEQHSIFAQQVAEDLGDLIESERGFTRASKLAQAVWHEVGSST